MPPKTSSRSGATRDKASSPPKPPPGLQSQSAASMGRRRTRSASVGSDNDTSPKRRSTRRTRQGSAESVESNASVASSTGAQSRKAARATSAISRKLSMVAEDQEMEEGDDEGHLSDEPNEFGGNEEHDGDGEAGAQRSQSPGALSQMSGTTAISAMTSHSMEQASNLDPIVVEFLPKLLESSFALLKLLAPEKVTAEPSVSETIVKDLKIHGSRTCRLLKIEEKVFDDWWSNFGSPGVYIDLPPTLRALIGTSDAPDGDFRPDAILHAANLAHLIRQVMILQMGHQESISELDRLDLNYPKPFVTGFDSKAQFGTSTLLDEFFDVGLEIRTQATILSLLEFQHNQHHHDFDPERILANNFYSPPATRNPRISEFNDMVENGSPKAILHGDPVFAPRGEGRKYTAKIRKRVKKIHSAFRDRETAKTTGDPVDFELLDEQYPWQQFQWRLARLARLRLNEISQVVKGQGGAENIKKSLIEVLQNRDSQFDVQYSPPASVIRSHVAGADRTASPPSFYPNRDGKSMIRSIQKLKQSITSSNPQSAQPNPTPMGLASSNDEPNPLPSVVSEDDHFMPNYGGEDDDGGETALDRASSEILEGWEKLRKDKNKENLPVVKQKRSLLDRQPNAKRVEWQTQETETSSSSSKRRREERDESESADEFQTDRRVPNPTRRTAAPPIPRFVPADDRPSPAKRARFSEDHEDFQGVEATKRNRQIVTRNHRERSATVEYDEEEDDEDDNIPHPTPSQIRVVAQERAKLTKLRNTPQVSQRRTAWSEADTDYLIDNIEIFGCAWSTLQKLPDWEHDRGQVALKDKARNLKVNFLKAGVELPLNFEHVTLGQKEIESVRRVIPDYVP